MSVHGLRTENSRNFPSEPAEEGSLVGNIYKARVKNIVGNIHGAFVEIDEGRLCFYPLDERRKPGRLGKTKKKSSFR